QTPAPEADVADETAKWQQLQQSIGNAAVARLNAVQEQAAQEDAASVDDATQGQISAARGRGEELPAQTRQALQPGFGQTLDGVRVHTDEQAGQLASNLHARAFTQGRDIFFAPGEFDPASARGRATLAHELTHVSRGTERVGAVHCLGENIPMPFAPGQRFLDEGPQMSLADPGGEVSMAPEYGASEGGLTREMVGGVEYTATTAFEWELGGNVLNIRVPIAFSGKDPKREWFQQIRSVWNHFDIVNMETGERVMFIFEPVQDMAGYPVQVLDGKGRSNESQWYLGDDRVTTAPHEFGHMLGLQEEYQVTSGHYEGITGEDLPEGDWLGGFGTIDEAAEAMHDEIADTATADQPARIYNVVRLYGLEQGSYSQAVADAYRDKWGELITALRSEERR